MASGPFEPTGSRSILDRIDQTGATKVKLAVTDVDGVLRGKYVAKDKFASALESGFGFCDVVLGWDSSDCCYDNVGFTGWHTGYPDAHVRLDPATYREVPWDANVPFLMGEFIDAGGGALPLCPRQVLKQVVARLEAAGFAAAASLEFEFFNFRETSQTLADKHFVHPQPMTPGMFGYSLLRLNASREYLDALFSEMRAFRVPIEGLHSETGPGVMEVALLYGEPVEAADRAVLFKSGVKEIAQRFGIMPSFMAKWNPELPGCSGHIHQSLWDGARKSNLFADDKAPHKMSAVFSSYLAGQLACMPDFLPLFAPTVNSYKRLVEGAWAPTRANWGLDNRTTALRVIGGSPKATRLETRVSGSDVNPYLALAAALGSGLYGIENRLKLEAAPITGSGYDDKVGARLPRNLFEATERFARSEIARAVFGAAFVDHFVATRHWEWRQFSQAVTDWETKRYFEII